MKEKYINSLRSLVKDYLVIAPEYNFLLMLSSVHLAQKGHSTKSRYQTLSIFRTNNTLHVCIYFVYVNEIKLKTTEEQKQNL
jgi:hypothetical protein